MTPQECLRRINDCTRDAQKLDVLNEFYRQAAEFDPFLDVELFHRHFGIAYEGKPRVIDYELLNFRLKFMREECTEFEDAMMAAQEEVSRRDIDPGEVTHYLDQCIDALGDILYVVLGTAHLCGFDLREAHRRIHAANMRKARAEHHPTTGEGRFKLKIVKPPNWEPPSHKDLVEDHAHWPRRAR